MSAEASSTEAEDVRRALEDWMIDNRWAYEAYDFSHALVASDWLARIKADAIAQERAAWVAKIEALASCPHGPRHYYAVDATCQRCEMPSRVEAAIRALLSSDATSRVHSHRPYHPVCNERTVDRQLRGACLNDDGSEVSQ